MTGLPGDIGRKKILTAKNFAGYRKQQGDAPSFSRAAPAQPGQQQTPLPGLRWSHEGLARYLDKKTFPAILAPSGLQLPRVEQIMRGTGKILTEKNLAGYRRQQGDAPSFSRAATLITYY